jgi:hypothetical protein
MHYSVDALAQTLERARKLMKLGASPVGKHRAHTTHDMMKLVDAERLLTNIIPIGVDDIPTRVLECLAYVHAILGAVLKGVEDMMQLDLPSARDSLRLHRGRKSPDPEQRESRLTATTAISASPFPVVTLVHLVAPQTILLYHMHPAALAGVHPCSHAAHVKPVLYTISQRA